MTKKQVLFSLRQRIDVLRERYDGYKSDPAISPALYDYYCGRFDAYEHLLEILSDYD